MNRLLTERMCAYYFAPTERNKQNLTAEGINKGIFVTGNTVIDAFQYTVQRDYVFTEKELEGINYNLHKVVLVTVHRRENLGKPLQNICNAIKRLALEYPETYFVYPVHLNPTVRDTVFP